MRVVVGMSGGVDSSVAALLLKRAGHIVTGLFMKNWEDDDDEEYCSSRADLIDAVSAAERIGIDIDQVNFSAEYKERVFAEFLREYRAGRTPNPDVLCNAEIKFRAFLDHALALGAERIATGHYARIAPAAESGARLLKGADGAKDQSYFLYRLTARQIAPVMFPVGELPKPQVRQIAREAGLAVHDKKDSTGICFIGERPFREFLNRYLPMTPGDIVTPDGRVVGRHVGLMFHTIGQRQGLGIGGSREGDGSPWYVAAKDIAANRLIAVQGHDHPLLLADRVLCTSLNWIGDSPPAQGTRLAAKTRYRQRDAACRVESVDSHSLLLAFDTPQWAVTPGQSAVLYDGDTCLGGGIIERAWRAP